SAVVALVPPFAFRKILDQSIPHHDHRQINVLAAIVVGAALADAALAVLQRFWSARIGEGLIYDLRVALFDKVQRMPIGFFTPARRVGKRLQEISRRQMTLNAEMNTQMTERFNVAGALLVKLFGRRSREVGVFSDRAGQVRDTGIRSAMYGRVFFVALGLVGA